MLLEQIDSAERLTLARYAQRTLLGPWSPGLVHLGDASHATSPQLGQGANMALLDAVALAAALTESRSLAQALPRYARKRRRHVLLYQAMSLYLTPIYQSDSRMLPWLRDGLLLPLAAVPPGPRVLAAMVAGLIGSPLKPLGLMEAATATSAE